MENQLELACAKIVHEVKNPIAIISSTLQLIELQVPEVKKNKYWLKLYAELDLVSSILNDFNKLCKCNYHDFKDIDLGELILDVYDGFEPFALKNKVSLSMSLPEDLFPIVADEFKLIEAFTNLLKNAVEAVEYGGHVHISLMSDNKFVNVIIEDDGCGIETSKLDTIFQPFITYKENGTGLGLPIVKSIMEMHNGTIEVESTIDLGTKFTVSLPLSLL